MYLVFGLFLFIFIILWFCLPFLISVTIPGFSAECKDLTAYLTKYQLVCMLLSAINTVQSSVYRAKSKFIWLELSALVCNAIALLLILLLLPRYGFYAIAWIGVLQLVLKITMLLPAMGMPLIPRIKKSTLVDTLRRITPLIFGGFYFKTDILFDRFLLSNLTSGTLSLYSFAQQIYGAINSILNRSIVGPFVSDLTFLHKAGDKSDFEKLYYRKFKQISLVTLLIFLFIVFFGKFIMNLLIGYGSFSSENITQIWWFLIWLGGALIAGILSGITTSVFYVVGDTYTPIKIGGYAYTFYIGLKFLLFFYLGVKGLALSTSFDCLVNLFAQVYFLRKKYGFSCFAHSPSR
jgi:putative peptidoglycan lipid II flippase